MTSLEKRRQIQNWAQTVAACANGIDELRVNEPPETSGTDRSETTAASYPTSIPPRKDPHVVRVIVRPSSSDGSIKSRDRSRGIIRSSRPLVVNDTSGSTSRSRPAYADSQERIMRRQKSPTRTSMNRRPSTPPGIFTEYITRRIPRPARPEPETSRRYYVDERPRYSKEEQLRVPSMPSKPSRPRPRSEDSRRIYYPRQRSPPTQMTGVRNPSPQRTTYMRVYESLPRRTASVRSRGDNRLTRRWDEDDRSNSEQRLNQLYDDVDKLRFIDGRRVYSLGDSRRRGRSFGYSSYDDYDYDYYDNRR